jgi:hypothetical protein
MGSTESRPTFAFMERAVLSSEPSNCSGGRIFIFQPFQHGHPILRLELKVESRHTPPAMSLYNA